MDRMRQVNTAAAIRAHVAHARAHAGSPEDVECALVALSELAEDLAPARGPLKLCACGESYDAAAWATLPLVGRLDDGVEAVESRNCAACQSTLGVIVGPSRCPAVALAGGASDEPSAVTASSSAAGGVGGTHLPGHTHAILAMDPTPLDAPSECASAAEEGRTSRR